jgi:large subunit ribosomal protein L24
MLFKVGDLVEVIAGNGSNKKDRGAGRGRARGKILYIDRVKKRVVVEGVAMVYKHVRRSQKNPQGGRLHREQPIDASNVMIVCPQTNLPSRMGVRFLADGTKERFAKKSGASLGAISPPRPRYAKKA